MSNLCKCETNHSKCGDTKIVVQSPKCCPSGNHVDTLADIKKLLDTMGELKTPYIGENGNWFYYDPEKLNWIDSGIKAEGVVGEKGEKGDTGPQGIQGVPGEKGDTGADGAHGNDGLSTYQIWLNLGNTGTEQEFIAQLKGAKGDAGERGEQGLQGTKGDKGDSGENGQNGTSPHIDNATGNWYIGEENTGVKAGGTVVSVNNILPDSKGNVLIDIPSGNNNMVFLGEDNAGYSGYSGFYVVPKYQAVFMSSESDSNGSRSTYGFFFPFYISATSISGRQNPSGFSTVLDGAYNVIIKSASYQNRGCFIFGIK